MKSVFTKAAFALMIGGALLAAIPAEADARGRGGYRGSGGGGHGGYRGGGYGRGRHYVGYRGHRGYRGGHRYGRYGYGGYGRHRGYGGYYGYGYPAYGYGGYPGYYGYGYYGGDAALAIGAGLLGVALGTAIGSHHDDRYYEQEYRVAPPQQMRTCPDGQYPSAEGYCPVQQQQYQQQQYQQQPQQPPAEYWSPERG